MRSDEVIIHFPPVKFEKGMEYLKGITGSMSSVVRDFCALKDEQQMVDFKYPSWVSDTIEEYREGKYNKDSDNFRNFNSALVALNIIKACARLNLAIYALQNKYKKKELELEECNPALSRYNSLTRNQSSMTRDYVVRQELKSLMYTTDADFLKIKDAASNVKDRIHSYNKKYTISDFEENFISNIKFPVYNICNLFNVETKTITERASETGSNILGQIIIFAILTLMLILVGKCATGQ